MHSKTFIDWTKSLDKSQPYRDQVRNWIVSQIMCQWTNTNSWPKSWFIITRNKKSNTQQIAAMKKVASVKSILVEKIMRTKGRTSSSLLLLSLLYNDRNGPRPVPWYRRSLRACEITNRHGHEKGLNLRTRKYRSVTSSSESCNPRRESSSSSGGGDGGRIFLCK